MSLPPRDQTIANVIFCSLLVLIESVQLLILVVLVFSFIPIPASPMVQHLFPRHLPLVFPKRDMSFYHFFVATVILGQAIVLTAWRKKMDSDALRRQCWPYFWVECGWLFFMVFAVFKYFVYDRALWATHLLYAVLAAAALSKIFWKELSQAARFCAGFLAHDPARTARISDMAFPLLITLLIFIPDLHGVVARMWIGDCLLHMDSSLIGQAWAFAKGAKLNVDIYTHYGLGLPIFTTLASNLLGGLTYERVVGFLVIGTIVYFILVYFFLRLWLKNIFLAMAGVLLAIKWQMFHQGNYPLIFHYPYSTVWRYAFDIVVMLLVLGHIHREKFYFLIAAGAVCGLALFHVTDTGVYLLLAYIFYVAWWCLESILGRPQHWKKAVARTGAALGTVFLSALVWFYVFQGNNVWSKAFWGNMLERADLFFIGHGNLPMYKSLVEGDYSSSLMGFVVPLMYMGTLIAVVGLCLLKKISRRHMLAAVVCVYGLGLYHYYIPRSANTAFYSVCVPFVLVLCWLMKEALRVLKPRWRTRVSIGLLGAAAFCLFSTHAYLSYPNVLNFSRDPILAPAVQWPNKNLPNYFNNIPRSYPETFKLSVNSLGEKEEDLKIESDFETDADLKSYFDREFDFNQDAALIDQLTLSDEAVALISSFSNKMLMQADRKPFFYYYPMVDSRPLKMRMFSFSILWTTERLAQTIKQLEQSKPRYVFMERVMLTREVPRIYLELFPEELYVLSYLDKHYTPYKYGQYLVALKRLP